MAEMLTKTAVVKAVEGRMALVTTRLEPQCEKCKARAVCFAHGGVNLEVRARNSAKAEVGDVVTIGISSSSFIKASFLVYMLPILAMVGGIVLGHFLSGLLSVDENLVVGLLAFLGLAGAFVWLKKNGDKLSRKPEFIPEIISKKTC